MDLQLASIEIPTPVALAIMAAIGYVFGVLRERSRAAASAALLRHNDDLSRAQMAVGELEQVIGVLRKSAAKHHSRLKRFRHRVAKLETFQEDTGWYELCREVDGVLDPTLQLVSEIASAQKRIRCQSDYLMSLSQTSTDPPSELGPRQATLPVKPDATMPTSV